jgi:hypothetical protein
LDALLLIISRASGLPRMPKLATQDEKDNYLIYKHALSKEIEKYETIAKNATKLWQSRGIIWND